jgi:hypothetical protein
MSDDPRPEILPDDDFEYVGESDILPGVTWALDTGPLVGIPTRIDATGDGSCGMCGSVGPHPYIVTAHMSVQMPGVDSAWQPVERAICAACMAEWTTMTAPTFDEYWRKHAERSRRLLAPIFPTLLPPEGT